MHKRHQKEIKKKKEWNGTALKWSANIFHRQVWLSCYINIYKSLWKIASRLFGSSYHHIADLDSDDQCECACNDSSVGVWYKWRKIENLSATLRSLVTFLNMGICHWLCYHSHYGRRWWSFIVGEENRVVSRTVYIYICVCWAIECYIHKFVSISVCNKKCSKCAYVQSDEGCFCLMLL